MAASTRTHTCAIFVAPLAISAILLSGCAVPLAPGYQVEKESLTVRFVAGSPPRLSIRADYELKNVGTAPLDSVDVILPAEKAFGFANLHVRVAAREVTPERKSADAATASGAFWRIPLAPSFRQKQRINLSVEYQLATAPPADSRIFVAANMFCLNDSGWFPEFQEPKALFAEDITRPNPTGLTVIVPAGFLATASGQLRGAKKRTAEMEYRFRIGKADFDPYVLAGRYAEQRISSNPKSVVLWTPAALPSAQAQQDVSEIAAATNFFSQNFGPLPKSVAAIFDAALPGDVAPSFLPGVIYDWDLPSGTSQSSSAGSISAATGTLELAHTWFSHLISPRPDSWILADGFSSYAVTMSKTEDKNSRTRAIRSLLAQYDSDLCKTVEKPIAFLAHNGPDGQVGIAAAKVQLFLFALEDQCGRENLTHAIAHMVYALRGQQYGYSDFRAALEQECHQNLAGVFRTWLAQTGIPKEFRARYAVANAPQKQSQ